MRKWILVGILSLVLVLSLVPMTAQAATTDTITITATGAEVNISIDTASWTVNGGYVYEGETYETGITSSWATLTNNGAEAVDVVVTGRSMKDAADTDTWTLSDTATAGADTFGMKAGNDDGDDTYDTIIKNSAGNTLIDELAGSGTQDFGLQFIAPTSMSTYELMEMVGTVGNHDDSDRGVLFTGSVD